MQPVGAVVVVAAGQGGDSGEIVRLRHANRYETMYLHLSRIAVRPGSRVAQGDVMRYIGATGLATGTHLDFGVSLRGKPVDPAKMIFPHTPPVAPSAFAEFVLLRDNLSSRLGQISFRVWS